MQEQIVAAARYFRESNFLIGVKENAVEKLLTLAILDGLTDVDKFVLDDSDYEKIHAMKLSEHPKKKKKSKKKQLESTTIFDQIYHKKSDIWKARKKWYKPKLY